MFNCIKEASEAMVKAIARSKERGPAAVTMVAAIRTYAGEPLFFEFDGEGNTLSCWERTRCLWRKPGSQVESIEDLGVSP